MRTWILACSLMMLPAGCGGGTPARVDAGTDPSRLDAGASEVDAGTPEVDAGAPEVDAGAPEVDAGTPEVDAGMSMLSCEANIDCGLRTGRYCDLGGGVCGGSGTCTVRPDACTRELRPVCGCDAMTYPNACEAARAGASVAAEGECALTCPARVPTGCCWADGQCGRGQRCVSEFCPAGLAGVCVDPARLSAGSCWEDSDCMAGRRCRGERICPCGSRCLLPDAPGSCTL